jgi:hypothetical protein
MRRTLIVLLAALSSAAPALAATSPPGVNLRWDHCFVDGGAANRNFACDTNAGSDRLAMSFELAGPLPDVVGVEFNVTLASDGPFLPAWWVMASPGTCRPTALTYETLPPAGSVQCTTWGGAGILGGIGSYAPGYLGGTTVLIKGVAAVSSVNTQDLASGIEYSLGSLVISHVRTVGAPPCPGCSTPVCILFSDVAITSQDPAHNPNVHTRLTHAANWSGSAIVGWQNGYIASSFPPGFDAAGVFFPAIITSCVPYSTTAARPSTWGAVKALYR